MTTKANLKLIKTVYLGFDTRRSINNTFDVLKAVGELHEYIKDIASPSQDLVLNVSEDLRGLLQIYDNPDNILMFSMTGFFHYKNNIIVRDDFSNATLEDKFFINTKPYSFKKFKDLLTQKQTFEHVYNELISKETGSFHTRLTHLKEAIEQSGSLSATQLSDIYEKNTDFLQKFKTRSLAEKDVNAYKAFTNSLIGSSSKALKLIGVAMLAVGALLGATGFGLPISAALGVAGIGLFAAGCKKSAVVQAQQDMLSDNAVKLKGANFDYE